MIINLKAYAPYFLISLSLIIIEQFIIDKSIYTTLLFSLILLIGGLPHGGLDFFILKKIYKGKKFIVSILFYFLIVAIFFSLFFFNPSFVFIFFLLYSAFHFGDSDFNDDHVLSKIGWGLTVITLPLLIDFEMSKWFFSVFLNEGNHINSKIILLIFAVSLLLSLFSKNDRVLKIILITTYLLTCFFGNIFYGFAAYFTGFHSAQHYKKWKSKIKEKTFSVLFIMTFIIIVLIIIQARFSILSVPGLLKSAEENMVFNIIILLGSLTFPHMILINRAKKIPLDIK